MDQGFNSSILTHQQQRSAGPRVPMSNHSLNTYGASLLFDPMRYTDPASLTDLAQQEYLSSVARNNQSIVPHIETEDAGEE